VFCPRHCWTACCSLFTIQFAENRPCSRLRFHMGIRVAPTGFCVEHHRHFLTRPSSQGVTAVSLILPDQLFMLNSNVGHSEPSKSMPSSFLWKGATLQTFPVLAGLVFREGVPQGLNLVGRGITKHGGRSGTKCPLCVRSCCAACSKVASLCCTLKPCIRGITPEYPQ
jgi:hypothetical protein